MEKRAGELGGLRPGEKLILIIRPSLRILLIPLLALFSFAYTVVLIPLAIILALFIFIYIISVLTLRYFITTHRVIMTRRFPRHDRREFALADIAGLTVVQGFIAKSLNYGSIHPQFPSRNNSQETGTVDRSSPHWLRALSQISRPNEISALINPRHVRKGS